jgi:hypothetical protein
VGFKRVIYLVTELSQDSQKQSVATQSPSLLRLGMLGQPLERDIDVHLRAFTLNRHTRPKRRRAPTRFVHCSAALMLT